MRKILMVACNTLDRGGVQAVMMSIIRNLSSKYIFDMIVFDSEEKYYDSEFLSYGGQLFRIPNYSGNSNFLKRAEVYYRGLFRYGKVKKIIKENGPYCAIHCNNDFEAAIYLKAANRMGIKQRIAHSHVAGSWVHFSKRLLNCIYQKMINKYANIRIGCSLDSCVYLYGTEKNCVVIGNSYNDKQFNQDNYINNTNISENKISLIQVGYFSRNKNQLFSINVLNEIIKIYSNSLLHLVGFEAGEEYEDLIKKRINELGLDKKVIFHEADSNIPQLLSSSSYFIFPSETEGFGIVLIEAQAMGLKCFASDTVPQITDCGGVTFLNLKEGAEAWAKRIIEDYSATRGMHQKYDCSKYSENMVIKEYDSIYERTEE